MRILVSGGTGFLGSHAVAEAASRGHDVVSLSRTGPRETATGPFREGVEHLTADLAEALPMERMGADAYLLCAAYVGGDEAVAQAMNVGGTERLIAAALTHGAPVVALSTLSVYGSGPHRGAAEGAIAPHPESAASRTRAAAEELVIAAGGTVLRTALTTGAGDRWVVPSVARLAARLGVPEELRSVRSSVIDVSALSRATVGTASRSATEPAAALAGRTFHLAHPDPVNLVALCERLTGLAAPSVDAGTFARNARGLGFSAHQLALLTEDHWYDSSAIWAATGEDPDPSPAANEAAIAWYRQLLAAD